MLDWKILAAGFAALLIASTVLVSGSGSFGLGDIFGRMVDWLKSSPFGGFFESPVASVKEVSIVLYPGTYTLKASSEINLSIGSIEFTGFSGDIEADFREKTMVFQQSGTKMKIKIPLEPTEISNIKIDKIFLDNTDFMVISDQLNTTAQNGTIEVSDFSGQLRFRQDSMELIGNVSMIKGNSKEIV
jgi:hypothetical protein